MVLAGDEPGRSDSYAVLKVQSEGMPLFIITNKYYYYNKQVRLFKHKIPLKFAMDGTNMMAVETGRLSMIFQ